MKAIEVVVIPEYKLKVTFDDGVEGVIDLEQLLAKGIFSILKNKEAFDKVYTTGYSIAWSDELEIDTLTIYAEIQYKVPIDLLSQKLNYASN